MQSFFANGFFISSSIIPPVPPWNPLTQFSLLIFWIDAKQAVSAIDYDATTKALVNWGNKAPTQSIPIAPSLVPSTDSSPVFESSGLLGNPDFFFDHTAAPVSCEIAAAGTNQGGFTDFANGWDYQGALFRSYVLQTNLAYGSTHETVLGVGSAGNPLTAGNDGGSPLIFSGPTASLNAILPSALLTLSNSWVGPINDFTKPTTVVLMEGKTTADGSHRRMYVSSPKSGTIPAFFAVYIKTDGILGSRFLNNLGNPVMFGPNTALSDLRLSECVLALDDPPAGGLVSNLDSMAAGQIAKWNLVPHPLVLCIGDSLTGGLGGVFNLTQGQYWPYLVGQSVTSKDFVNAGINSKTALGLQSDAPSYSFLVRSGVNNTAIIWAGTNDIDAAASTAAGSYANLSGLITAIRSAGYTKIVVLTCIPRDWSAFGAGGGGSDAERLAFNALVIANSASADLVIDPTTNAAFDSNSSWSNLTNYQSDGIHLTVAGQAVLAGIIAAANP